MATETQAPAANTAESAESQPDSASIAEQIGGIDNFEQLAEILNESNRPASRVKAEAPEEDAEEEEEPEDTNEADEPESEEEPEAEADEPESEEPEGEKKKASPKNFRFHAKDDRQAQFLALLRAAPDANPIDLARAAGYTSAEAKEAVKETKEVEKSDPFTAERTGITDLETQIEAIRTKRDQKRLDFENAEADKLTDELADLKLQLRDTKRELVVKEAEHAEQVVEQAAYAQDLRVASAKAVSRYPDTAKKDSRQARLVQSTVAYHEAHTPGFFDQPDYPERILNELERDFPEVFDKPKSKVPTKTGQPAAQAKPARPMGKGVPATKGTPTEYTTETATREIENMSLEQLKELSNAVGTQPKKGGNMVNGYFGG